MPIPVEALLKKKENFQRDPDRLPHDFREEVFHLEEQGEWIVQRAPDPLVEVPTKYGRL